MVATHLARQHLATAGGCALAAGVNLMLAETTTAAAHAAGMLTPDGRCKALDASADGYVRSEACVVVLLTAAAAAADGLRAANGGGGGGLDGQQLESFSGAVLRTSYVNQDGRSSSLTAPNGPSQQQVLLPSHPGHFLLPVASGTRLQQTFTRAEAVRNKIVSLAAGVAGCAAHSGAAARRYQQAGDAWHWHASGCGSWLAPYVHLGPLLANEQLQCSSRLALT
jgi:Beta-ketoacyl synthase, N-terminal domain